ncbi:hypothetical protein [Lactobacillus sp. 3B(2020)]|uniref:hypothetical protein n=1 Tax=Lactobacillus sp. 3B(2020) TaxID=2695882 RepID=UPI0015E00879|nr:hypothetical protein [Lactobacillus sp. 3B(2020)]QLL70239.1 hypothetical protein GTO83_06670 [Lactobacillus sp. 3B(2020)]
MNLNKHGELSVPLNRLTEKYGRMWYRLAPDGRDSRPIDPDLAEIWLITGGQPPKQWASSSAMPPITPQMVNALRQAINDIPSMTKIQKRTGLTEKQILAIFYRFPELENKFQYNQNLYPKVVIGDQQANRIYNFNYISEAARWLNVDRNVIVNLLKYRHGGGLIKRRYRVKRKLWYGLDGGFD